MNKLYIVLCFILFSCNPSRNYVVYFTEGYDNDSVKVFDGDSCIYDELISDDFSTGLSDELRFRTKKDSIIIWTNGLNKKIPLKPFKKNTPYILVRFHLRIEYDSREPTFW